MLVLPITIPVKNLYLVLVPTIRTITSDVQSRLKSYFIESVGPGAFMEDRAENKKRDGD